MAIGHIEHLGTAAEGSGSNGRHGGILTPTLLDEMLDNHF
ncbi:hypothetical protein MM1S1530915_3067 [Mycobacteroides abscessus subsp. bolletii 1S-153-0915]|nr:hypothetical protein MM1S1530915_3067 [Mycobacteroides abscessus subsp. bolletii 1S-153-0915]